MRHDESKRVAVTVDVSVPRRFTVATDWVDTRGYDSKGQVEGDIEFDDDGRRYVHTFRFVPRIDEADLDRVDWTGTIAKLVHMQAAVQLFDVEGYRGEDGGARFDRLERSLSRSLQRRRGLTDAELETIAAAYRKGGTQLVGDQLHVGYRQASRYVAKARTAGLL